MRAALQVIAQGGPAPAQPELAQGQGQEEFMQAVQAAADDAALEALEAQLNSRELRQLLVELGRQRQEAQGNAAELAVLNPQIERLDVFLNTGEGLNSRLQNLIHNLSSRRPGYAQNPARLARLNTHIGYLERSLAQGGRATAAGESELRALMQYLLEQRREYQGDRAQFLMLNTQLEFLSTFLRRDERTRREALEARAAQLRVLRRATPEPQPGLFPRCDESLDWDDDEVRMRFIDMNVPRARCVSMPELRAWTDFVLSQRFSAFIGTQGGLPEDFLLREAQSEEEVDMTQLSELERNLVTLPEDVAFAQYVFSTSELDKLYTYMRDATPGTYTWFILPHKDLVLTVGRYSNTTFQGEDVWHLVEEYGEVKVSVLMPCPPSMLNPGNAFSVQFTPAAFESNQLDQDFHHLVRVADNALAEDQAQAAQRCMFVILEYMRMNQGHNEPEWFVGHLNVVLAILKAVPLQAVIYAPLFTLAIEAELSRHAYTAQEFYTLLHVLQDAAMQSLFLDYRGPPDTRERLHTVLHALDVITSTDEDVVITDEDLNKAWALVKRCTSEDFVFQFLQACAVKRRRIDDLPVLIAALLGLGSPHHAIHNFNDEQLNRMASRLLDLGESLSVPAAQRRVAQDALVVAILIKSQSVVLALSTVLDMSHSGVFDAIAQLVRGDDNIDMFDWLLTNFWANLNIEPRALLLRANSPNALFTLMTHMRQHRAFNISNVNLIMSKVSQQQQPERVWAAIGLLGGLDSVQSLITPRPSDSVWAAVCAPRQAQLPFQVLNAQRRFMAATTEVKAFAQDSTRDTIQVAFGMSGPVLEVSVAEAWAALSSWSILGNVPQRAWAQVLALHAEDARRVFLMSESGRVVILQRPPPPARGDSPPRDQERPPPGAPGRKRFRGAAEGAGSGASSKMLRF